MKKIIGKILCLLGRHDYHGKKWNFKTVKKPSWVIEDRKCTRCGIEDKS
jgi:hypothetical protein